MLRALAGGRLFGSATGDGSPRVVALHGWRRTSADFTAVLQGLDGLALDLPGFGSSPEPPEPWGSAQYAALVAEVLDATQPAVVIGHSFGGRVALHLAAAHPDRVAALVLTGVPQLFPREGPAPKAVLGYRLARTLRQRGLISQDRLETLIQRNKWGSDDFRASQGVMRGVFTTLMRETYEEQLRTITRPAELVWGENDTAAPVESARKAAATLANGHLTVLDGVGHMVPLERPDELRKAIEVHL
jgi:pimeloyl-ACP methyl ester carboxylesterase